MATHPDHDEVAAEVRRWYMRSTPEIGISIHEKPYGFLTSADSPAGARVMLSVETASQVTGALEAAAAFYGDADFDVWVDDRQRAARLARALGVAGLEPLQDTVVLALVGPLRARPGPDFALEEATDPEGLRQWVTVRLQAFADSEDDPGREQVDAEMAVRMAEWPVCRYQMARLAGEAVAVLGHYTGQDQMVFILGTRVPFRHRGIAQTLLKLWWERGQAEGVRSLLINCDEHGRPAALYRRMGFADEVRWHRRYRRGSRQ